jgi:hypothetical protein
VATPFETFEKSMGRVEGLLRLHPKLHGIRGRPAQHVSDVLRGALVLAVGALDALVLQSVTAAIPPAARQGRLGRTVAKWVKDDPDGFLRGLAQEEPAEALADLCGEHLGALTFQRAAAIEGVLADVLSCRPPWPVAAQILTVTSDTAWDVATVKARLDEFVERRHRIAHSGDLLPGSGSTRPITRPYVEEAALVIRAVGHGIDQVATELHRRHEDR